MTAPITYPLTTRPVTALAHGIRQHVVVRLLLCLAVVRVPALLHPRATDDEQVYAVVAREMLKGGRPYLDAIERKPPLLFVVYEAVLKLAGPSNWAGLHLVSLLWTLATMAALYAIARSVFDSAATGRVAALLYGLFQLWADYRNLGLNGELLMNLPIAVAFLLAFASSSWRWRPELFLSGMLIAVAFLLKQPAGIAGLPLATYVISPAYRSARGLGWRDSLWQALELALGFGAGLAIAGALLIRYGILNEAIYWTILAHLDPIGPTNLQFWIGAAKSTGFFLVEALPLCLAAAVSTSCSFEAVWRGKEAERQALIVLLLASVIGVSASGQFLYHYYLQLLLPLSLLAAPVISGMLDRPSVAGQRLTVWLAFLLALFTTIDTIGLANHRRPSAAAAWTAMHSTGSDRLYVWGQGDDKTGMYLDADRRPASRFILPFPLTGHVFGGYPEAWGTGYEDGRALPGAWDTLALDFGRHQPTFVIDAESAIPGTRYPVHRYPRLEYLLQHQYREVAALPDGVVYKRDSP